MRLSDRLLISCQADALFELHGPCPELDRECVSFSDFLALILIMVTVKSLSNNGRVEPSGLHATKQDMVLDQFMTKVPGVSLSSCRNAERLPLCWLGRYGRPFNRGRRTGGGGKRAEKFSAAPSCLGE